MGTSEWGESSSITDGTGTLVHISGSTSGHILSRELSKDPDLSFGPFKSSHSFGDLAFGPFKSSHQFGSYELLNLAHEDLAYYLSHSERHAHALFNL